MDSYRLSNPYKDDTWFTDKFDKLYDMELEALKYLADIRKIKTKNLVEY